MMEIERFAQVLAHIRHFGFEYTDQVCERLGMNAADWQTAQRHWTDELSKSAATDDATLVMTFAKHQSQVEAELAERQPKLEDIGPQDAPLSETFEGLPPSDDPEPPPLHGVQRDPPPANAEPPRVELPRTPAPGPPPIASSAPAPTAPSPWASRASSPAQVLDATAPAGLVIGEALPFDGERAAPPPVSAKVHPSAGATVEAKAPLADEPDIDGTAMITELNLDDPLPFADGDAPPPSLSALDEPSPDAGATAFVGALTDEDLGLPFDPSPTALSLEHYASLQAELTVYPRQAETVLQRYRLDRSSLAELDAAFAKRFATSPDEKRRCDALQARYAAWLRTRS